MTKTQVSKYYDLEDRTLKFATQIRNFVKIIPNNNANREYLKQLIRSSGSVGANYIEANEALSKKDFILRIKICRKESKESRYWLLLLDLGENSQLHKLRQKLIDEVVELMKIFGSIVTKAG